MKTFTEKLMGFVEKRDATVRSYRKCAVPRDSGQTQSSPRLWIPEREGRESR